MIATIPYVEKKFEEFNQQMFAGRLPKLPIELSDAKTFLGKCVYRKRINTGGKTEYYDFRLRINTRIDLPEQEIEDTIIHEMIHYFIRWNQMEDASSHGPIFQHMMNSINEKYGRHVCIRHKGTEEQNEQAIDKRQHWHVIAVVYFKDGRTGVKVLPRVMPSIVNFYNKVVTTKDVVNIELFMSNDIFFNRYPNSSALKVHYVDAGVIKEHLKGAEVLKCDGTTIIRNKK